MQNKSADEKPTAEVLDFTEENQTPELHKHQKIAAIVLGFFSLLVLVLMIIQFRHNIYAPFSYAVAPASTVAPGQDLSSVAALKNKDTDGDGLSDYDEIYVYHTSPYLEDTDGDGFSDYEEVKNGTDPNCPAGQTCTSSPLTNSNQIVSPDMLASSSTASIYNGSGYDMSAGAADNNPSLNITSSTDATAEQNLLNGQSDPQALRQLLLEGGMDKATLDKISDTDLIKSYQDTLSSTTSANASASQ